MLSYPPLLKWAVDNGARVVIFEQCQTGLAAQKTTQLLATPDALNATQREFARLRCRHATCSFTGRPHTSHLGDTSGLEHYTPDAR